MRYFVEVQTRIPGCCYYKRHEAPNWNATLVLAEKIASTMFPEDPMATRTFRNGRLKYFNRNDMGDPVLVHPVAFEGDEATMAPDLNAFGNLDDVTAR